MKSLTLGFVALSLVFAGSASAADMRMPVKAPPAPPPPVFSWTGCYVGGGGGYGFYDQRVTSVDGGFPFGLSNDNSGRGWFGTVQVGCDYQISQNFVIGAFGDYDFSSIKGDASFASFGVVGHEKLKNAWAAGGRIGWIPVPQLLAYVSGGYTEAQFDPVNLFDPVAGVSADAFLAKNTYSGWFVGGGYEYGLTWFPIQGVFWKTEYRYSEFDTDRVPILDLATALPTGSDIDTRKRVQTIRTELVWRFNFSGPVSARY